MNVTFTDASTNTPTARSWDFGDGTTSTERNPSHSYAKGGGYTVALTASNEGGSDTVTKADYIKANTFTDVLTDNWAWANIEASAAAGTVQGYADGTYQPGAVATRDQMAVYIARGWPTSIAWCRPHRPPLASRTCRLTLGLTSTSNTPTRKAS